MLQEPHHYFDISIVAESISNSISQFFSTFISYMYKAMPLISVTFMLYFGLKFYMEVVNTISHDVISAIDDVLSVIQ
jgi:NhaP-type Na+/H+ or K+/H+ antiporter